jgi:hypothetical protein
MKLRCRGITQRKNTTFRTQQKLEIKNDLMLFGRHLTNLKMEAAGSIMMLAPHY